MRIILGIAMVLSWTVVLSSGLSLSGCASGSIADSNSPEGAFKAAEEFEKDERYEEALAKFNEVKNKHPYSRFAIEAELHIADIHYKREAFIEAQTAYQLFKDFHPKYAKIDYVTYRLAMSYYEQLPPTADRDLAPASKAIQFFDEVISAYPSSTYVADSKVKRAAAFKLQAEKEEYIAHFYFIREMYDSALKRYEGLISKFPGAGFDEKGLYMCGLSAYETSNPELGKKYLNDLVAKYPESDWSHKAKSALNKYGNR